MPDGGIEVEKLYVSIESDVARLIMQTRSGVKEVEVSLGQMSQRGGRAFDDVGKSAKQSSFMIGLVSGVVQQLVAMLANLARQAIQTFVGIGQAAIQTNAQFESYIVQFQTLLGSTEAAQQRMQELAEFGLKTPFELPEIIQASRQLEVFGGAALATGDNLRMVGDIAAGVGRPFQEVAFWIGRMYDALQSGRPWGEAAIRLQEMGALSGDARARLERLSKAGQDGNEVWKVFTEQVGGRFAGNMDRLSKTFQGIMSNLADFSNWLLRIAGKPAFEEIKDSAARLMAILEKNRPELEKLAEAFGEVAANVVDFLATGLLDNLETMDFQEVMDMVDALGGAVESARTLADILSTMQVSLDLIQGVTDVADALSRALKTAAQLSALAGAETARKEAEAMAMGIPKRGVTIAGTQWDLPWRNIAAGVPPSPTEEAKAAGQEAYNKFLIDAVKIFEVHEQRVRANNATMNQGQQIADRFRRSHEGVAGTVRAEGEAMDQAAEAMDKLLEKSTDAMLDAVADRQEKVQELEQEHGEKLTEIDQETAERRVEINQQLQDQLAELAEETARRRAELIAGADQQLAELEETSARDRAQQETEFRTSQRREQQDFNREMSRLQFRYLEDVQDAVRRRDARAVEDLRKRFLSDKQTRTEDFTTQQGRQRQDHERSLQASRDAEGRRRQEIQRNLAGQLRDLQDNEARKRRDLQTSHQRQLAELEASAAKERARENASYQQRQAALQQALAQRLSAIAKALADERSIDAAHARQLLEALNKTFGAGGDIDKLMLDFQARRRQRMIVSVEFAGVIGPAPTSGAGHHGGGFYTGGATGYAAGGTLIADRPTLAMFGEAGPEVAQFIPLSQMKAGNGNRRLAVDLTISGSAPPGVGPGEVNTIAGVLLKAFKDAGVLVNKNTR
jgi:hypothetical protein